MNTYKLGPLFTKLKKESDAITSECYVSGCGERTIKAHSVSEAKVLERISKNGHVLYFNTNDVVGGEVGMKSTGKGSATTFRGFCAEHDTKLFKAIDVRNYVLGDKEQEFLFAYRSAAREFSIRTSLGYLQQEMLSKIKGDKNDQEILRAFGANPEEFDIESLELFNEQFGKGTNHASQDRIILNANMQRKRWWKIDTATLVINGEYPIAVSSNFKLESDQYGNVINDIALGLDPKMTYLNIFPQNGKTYALLSYAHKNKKTFLTLDELTLLGDIEKKIILSNLISKYVENFTVNEDYWEDLPKNMRYKFERMRGFTYRYNGVSPMVIDKTLNIFI